MTVLSFGADTTVPKWDPGLCGKQLVSRKKIQERLLYDKEFDDLQNVQEGVHLSTRT